MNTITNLYPGPIPTYKNTGKAEVKDPIDNSNYLAYKFDFNTENLKNGGRY